MGRGQGIYRQWKRWPTRREADRKNAVTAPKVVHTTDGEERVLGPYRVGGLVATIRVQGAHACVAYSADGTLLGPCNPRQEPTTSCTITGGPA